MGWADIYDASVHAAAGVRFGEWAEGPERSPGAGRTAECRTPAKVGRRAGMPSRGFLDRVLAEVGRDGVWTG